MFSQLDPLIGHLRDVLHITMDETKAKAEAKCGKGESWTTLLRDSDAVVFEGDANDILSKECGDRRREFVRCLQDRKTEVFYATDFEDDVVRLGLRERAEKMKREKKYRIICVVSGAKQDRIIVSISGTAAGPGNDWEEIEINWEDLLEKYEGSRKKVKFFSRSGDLLAEVVEDQCKVDGLGGIVWNGALALARYLELHIELAEQTVLELGCGSGLVGIICKALGARKVLLTDQYVVSCRMDPIDAQVNLKLLSTFLQL